MGRLSRNIRNLVLFLAVWVAGWTFFVHTPIAVEALKVLGQIVVIALLGCLALVVIVAGRVLADRQSLRGAAHVRRGQSRGGQRSVEKG